jgi:hypothetical protein
MKRVIMVQSKAEVELRNMKLHMTMKIGNITILKVLGGWIYWNQSIAKGAAAGVFVPNSEESFAMIRKMQKEMKKTKKSK